MPKRVDHEERRREIVEAVIRITLKGGLTAATVREVAAEAGVSVRLVQYYFGSKDALLLATQQHLARARPQPKCPRGVHHGRARDGADRLLARPRPAIGQASTTDAHRTPRAAKPPRPRGADRARDRAA